MSADEEAAAAQELVPGDFPIRVAGHEFTVGRIGYAPGKLTVIAGGDKVYVFGPDQAEAAYAQQSALAPDVERWVRDPARWSDARARLPEEITVVDMRDPARWRVFADGGADPVGYLHWHLCPHRGGAVGLLVFDRDNRPLRAAGAGLLAEHMPPAGDGCVSSYTAALELIGLHLDLPTTTNPATTTRDIGDPR
jgi:hypothetical protein